MPENSLDSISISTPTAMMSDHFSHDVQLIVIPNFLAPDLIDINVFGEARKNTTSQRCDFMHAHVTETVCTCKPASLPSKMKNLPKMSTLKWEN